MGDGGEEIGRMPTKADHSDKIAVVGSLCANDAVIMYASYMYVSQSRGILCLLL